MSGGRYDYIHYRIEEFNNEMELNTTERKKFKKLLSKVISVIKAIEWEDSGDTSEEDTNKEFKKLKTVIRRYYDTTKKI